MNLVAPVVPDLWTPNDLGVTARWTPESRFITLSGSDVTNWRNHINGRSGVPNPGVLNTFALGVDPSYNSSFQAMSPTVDFTGGDRLQEVTNGAGSQAAVADCIRMVSGTNSPISILMTLRSTTSGAEQIFLAWSGAGTGVYNVRITAADEIMVTRVDDAASSLDIQGGTMGTVMRRVGITFDGTSIAVFIDSGLVAASNAFGTLGALTVNSFRLGATDSNMNLQIGDVTLVPRGIRPGEWIRYVDWSTRLWGPRTLVPPTFISAGAGTGLQTSGTLNIAYPGSLLAGDTFIVQLCSRTQTTPPTTPTGWSLFYGPDANANSTSYIYVRDARATGSESGTEAFTTGNADMWLARMYAFRGVATGTFAVNGTTVNVTSGSAPGPSITTAGPGRLCVAFYVIDQVVAMEANTGSSGGTWSEPVAEYQDSSGNNSSIQLQTCPLQLQGTVSGGTSNFGGGSDDGIGRAFALIGT